MFALLGAVKFFALLKRQMQVHALKKNHYKKKYDYLLVLSQISAFKCIILSLWVQGEVLTKRRSKDCIRNAGSGSFCSTLRRQGGWGARLKRGGEKGGIWEYSLSSSRSTTHTTGERTQAPGWLDIRAGGFSFNNQKRKEGKL